MFVFLFKNFLHVTSFVFNTSKEIFACKLNFEELILIWLRRFRITFLLLCVRVLSTTSELFVVMLTGYFFRCIGWCGLTCIRWWNEPLCLLSYKHELVEKKPRNRLNDSNVPPMYLDLMRHTLHLLTQISNLQCRKTGYDFQRLNRRNIGSELTLCRLCILMFELRNISHLPFGLVRSPCMVSGLLRFFNM